VIRGLQQNPDISVLSSLAVEDVESMFARIDDATLPEADKELLQKKIAEISDGLTIGPNDRVIAHFLSKLISLYKEQQKNESAIRDFVSLCNAYLTGKQLVYDDTHYKIFIRQGNSGISKSADTEDLPMKALSSGEKQIVSLFSHMYLSGEQKFFVVIDEPELSLSVPWQERLLPDILRTERCSGLIAVTHSPFIWDNDLEEYVHPLAEFVRTEHVV
jgi:hypothetical protein